MHDPSVIREEGTDNYYIFGSHMAVAKTNDLVNWEQVNTNGENDTDSSLFGVKNGDTVTAASFNDAFVKCTYTGTVDTLQGAKEFGSYNAAAWNTAVDGYTVSGNMWAPDIIYNRARNTYQMYLSLNGSKRNSVIILLESKDIEGPYVYVGPVVYTGFTTDTDKSVARSYKNTDLELVLGEQAALPARYDKVSDDTWGTYWPHAIDPCVFYDEEGNLIMAYGSWHGGIYELELDEQTGLRDYTVSYASDFDEKQGSVTSDPYLGKKIAGGYYVSGEGPYIQYIDGKYYLFMSYGEYAPNGNYQMRMFSSDKPDGPFVDTNGVSAIYDEFTVNFNANYGDVYDGSDWAAPGTTRGSRLMTSYRFDTMSKGEISQGHNSAIVTEDGAFVVYHTKFDDGTDGHEVRVHQLYTVDGALVAAPYEYDNKVVDKTSYTSAQLAADYGVIFSKYSTNVHWSGGADADHMTEGQTTPGSLANSVALECETPQQFAFGADGKVVCDGTAVGTWALDSDGKHATITINNTIGDAHLAGTYHAVVIEQNAGGKQATCFTGINVKTGISIWGSMDGTSPQKAIALTNQNVKISIPASTSESVTLPTEGLSGATISWKSSNPVAMTDRGTVRGVTENTPVTLTETISCKGYYYEKTYDIMVLAPDASRIELTGNDYLKEMDNPFYQKELNSLYIKYTINWKDAAAKNGWDGLFSFYNSQTTGRVSVQSAPYVCYNEMAPAGETNKYMDINFPDSNNAAAVNKAAAAEKGKDYTYEIIITTGSSIDTTTGGSIVMKENGVEFTPSLGGAENTYVTDMLEYIAKECDKFSWGVGIAKTSFWNTEVCSLKDIVISDQVPTSAQQTEAVEIGGEIPVRELDNPFLGKEINSFTGEYTVTYPEGAVDTYGSLFAFYTSNTNGRISIHQMPYICYNECLTEPNKWMDLKSAVEYKDGGKSYKVKFVVNKEGVTFYVDGQKIDKLNIAGSGATYEDLLSYLSTCDKYSIGNNDRTFWGKIPSATLSDIRFAINEENAVKVPVELDTKYIVSYDMQGHGAQLGETLVKEGETVAKPANPSTVGYTFGGWYKDAACTQAWDFAADIVTADMILYAKWTAIQPEGNTNTGTGTGSSDTTTAPTTPETTEQPVKNIVIEGAAVAADGTLKDANGKVIVNALAKTKDGTMYIADEAGQMLKNQIVTTHDGTKYAVKKTGVVAVNQVVVIHGDRYLAQTDGTIAIGGFYDTARGNTVYANADGKLALNRVVTVKGKKYYATKTGAIAKKQFAKTVKGNRVYAKASGVLVTGHSFKVNGARYYATKTGAIAVKKWVKIGNKQYYCNAAGKITKVKKR